MRRYINGKWYDTRESKGVYQVKTDKALLTLYRKKTGEYFLHYIRSELFGVRKVPYRREGINPMTTEQAEVWIKRYVTEGPGYCLQNAVEDSDARVVTTISINRTVLRNAKALAARSGCTISALIESLLSERLDHEL